LAVPNLAVRLAGAGAQAVGARRISAYLHSRNLLLNTAVGREIEWLIMTELLELPFRQGQAGVPQRRPGRDDPGRSRASERDR
jgi:hypothetical protein